MQFSRLLFVASVLAAGCSDSDNDDPIDDGGTDAPVYIGATRVFSGDTSAGYLFTTSSIDAGAKIDLGTAIEIDDAWVFGDAKPYFYTATIFAPQITRWTLDDAGKPVKGPAVSFVNAGVTGTYIAAGTPIFSATKSYFVDSGSNQVVVWNPTEMTLIKTIKLDIPQIAGATPTLDLAVTNNKLFVTVFWGVTDSQNTAFGDHVRVIAIDPATDTVASSTDEPRCQTTSFAGVTSTGTAYFTPWDYHAAVRGVFGAGFGAASCALRIVPAGAAFEAGYDVDMSALVGGKPAGSLALTSDTDALIHVWNQDLVPATPATWGDDRFKPGYTWYRWHLGDTTATPLPNQQPSSEGGDWRMLDGKTVTYAPNEEYSETTIRTLGADDTLTTGATVPGWIAYMIRAR